MYSKVLQIQALTEFVNRFIPLTIKEKNACHPGIKETHRFLKTQNQNYLMHQKKKKNEKSSKKISKACIPMKEKKDNFYHYCHINLAAFLSQSVCPYWTGWWETTSGRAFWLAGYHSTELSKTSRRLAWLLSCFSFFCLSWSLTEHHRNTQIAHQGPSSTKTVKSTSLLILVALVAIYSTVCQGSHEENL